MTMTQFLCLGAIILLAPHINKYFASAIATGLIVVAIFWAVK